MPEKPDSVYGDMQLNSVSDLDIKPVGDRVASEQIRRHICDRCDYSDCQKYVPIDLSCHSEE